jgi:tetratricopeptide (TPR) repeat protein
MVNLDPRDIVTKLRLLFCVVVGLFGGMHIGALVGLVQDSREKRQHLARMCAPALGFEEQANGAWTWRFEHHPLEDDSGPVPGNPQLVARIARQALAGVLMDARLPNDAMLVLQEGLQIAPAQFGFSMMAARLHVERGELDAAVQTLARSAEYAGNSADYAGFYAGLLQRQKKHAEAVEYFDRALRLRPNSGVWLLGMGMSLEALGRNAEAQEAFRRAKTSGNLTQELQNFVDQRLR